jgi:hypothetical protein
MRGGEGALPPAARPGTLAGAGIRRSPSLPPRIIACFTVGAAGLGVLAGCGGSSSPSQPNTPTPGTAGDYLATGKSAATGRWGPTWTWEGKPCDGENFTSCANHQDNQFMAIAKTTGRYDACASSEVAIHPEGQACGGVTIK